MTWKQFFYGLFSLPLLVSPFTVFAYADFLLPIKPPSCISNPDPVGAMTEPCSYLLDDNTGTYNHWLSTEPTVAISEDLNGNYALSRVTVNNFSGAGTYNKIEILTSFDGTTYVSQFSTTSAGFTGVQVFSFAPVSAHFVRYVFTNNSDSTHYLVDLDAYGTEIIENTTLTAFAGSSSSNSDSGSITFVIGVMMIMMFIFFSSYIYNSITDKKRKPWQ